jgi:hypothetical protein
MSRLNSSAQPDHRAAAPGGPRHALAVIAIWIPLFALGTVVHESLHAAAVLLLGSHPELVLRPWPLALIPLTITGIHVQPVPALDATGQFIDNIAGPGVAAILFGLVGLRLPRGTARHAVLATVLGLVFYALIEPADVVLDGRLEVGFLTAPEFNYGVPLLFAIVVACTSAWRASPPPQRKLIRPLTST